MPDSQNPEHVQKLVQEFQLKGGNLIPSITAEIVPTVLVADLSREARAEDRRGVVAVVGAAAGAGNQNVFDLVNPAGSGVLVHVESFWVKGAAIDNVGIDIIAGGSATGNAVWRDLRIAGRPACKILRSALAAAALPAVSWNVADVSLPLEINYSLTPGNRLRFRQDAQNTAMDLSIFFRERDLRTGE